MYIEKSSVLPADSQSIIVHGKIVSQRYIGSGGNVKKRNITSEQNILTGSKLCWDAILRQGQAQSANCALTQYFVLTEYVPWALVESLLIHEKETGLF